MNRKIKIIGLGGIGTALYPTLYQFLQHRTNENWEVWLFDGDKYELKNATRQFVPNGADYPINENKAAVNARELKKLFPGINFKPCPFYIDELNIYTSIEDGDIVISGVDNHNSRKVFQDHCESLDNIAIISGGNDLVTGDVLLYHKVDGQELLRPMTVLQEIAEPEDHHPGEGCDHLAPSVPQIGIMNNMVASQILVMLYCLLEDSKFPAQRVYLNMKTGACRAIKEYEC